MICSFVALLIIQNSLFIAGNISCSWPLCLEYQEPGALQGRCWSIIWNECPGPPHPEHPYPGWFLLLHLCTLSPIDAGLPSSWEHGVKFILTPSLKLLCYLEWYSSFGYLAKPHSLSSYSTNVSSSVSPWLHKGELISHICNPANSSYNYSR